MRYNYDPKLLEFLSTRCNVTQAVARIALDHARGRIPEAIELLKNDQCLHAFMREAREYGCEE
jgi:hypothetical protein